MHMGINTIQFDFIGICIPNCYPDVSASRDSTTRCDRHDEKGHRIVNWLHLYLQQIVASCRASPALVAQQRATGENDMERELLAISIIQPIACASLSRLVCYEGCCRLTYSQAATTAVLVQCNVKIYERTSMPNNHTIHMV